MDKILVTGANSLLATNIIIELLSNGYAVKGLLRNSQSFHYKQHPYLELIQGDVTKIHLVKELLSDCVAIIHVAAITDQNLTSYEAYKRVNVDATDELLKLAIETSIKKFIYIGSANSFGFGTKENPGNETKTIKPPFSESYYALSKLKGQEVAFSYNQKIDVVSVSPTFMLGSFDSKPSSGKIVMMGYKKRIIFYPPGGKSFVHVQDVAKGVLKALEVGKNGESYLLTNQNLSYKEFFKKLSAITNNNPIYIKIPKPVLYLAGVFGNILRVLGIKSDLSLVNMKILCINNFYSNDKAVQELGLTFKPIEQSIEDAINWFKEHKILSTN